MPSATKDSCNTKPTRAQNLDNTQTRRKKGMLCFAMNTTCYICSSSDSRSAWRLRAPRTVNMGWPRRLAMVTREPRPVAPIPAAHAKGVSCVSPLMHAVMASSPPAVVGATASSRARLLGRKNCGGHERWARGSGEPADTVIVHYVGGHTPIGGGQPQCPL
jgi:hypothetical protein